MVCRYTEENILYLSVNFEHINDNKIDSDPPRPYKRPRRLSDNFYSDLPRKIPFTV